MLFPCTFALSVNYPLDCSVGKYMNWQLNSSTQLNYKIKLNWLPLHPKDRRQEDCNGTVFWITQVKSTDFSQFSNGKLQKKLAYYSTLYVRVCLSFCVSTASSLPFKDCWLRDAPTVWHSTTVRSAHTVFMCFVFIWEQTATCATYTINWLVFITVMKSVYCAVRTGSLNKKVCASYLKG